MIAQIILPIILLVIAGGVYFGLTDPLINGDGFLGGEQNIAELRQEKASLKKALTDAADLKDRAAELEQKVQSIAPEKIARLDDFLPDAVDDLQLIVDVNNIASRSNMRLNDVTLGRASGPRAGEEDKATVEPEVATVQVSFTVVGAYGDFKNFLRDISTSLRILEVKELEFSSTAEGGAMGVAYAYDVTVETYYLK